MPPKPTNAKPPASSRAARASKRAAEAAEVAKKKQKKTTTSKKKLPVSRKKDVEEEDVEVTLEPQGGRKRELNYIEEEDICLCIACVNVLQDGAVATNQSLEDFWGRISSALNEQQAK